MGTGRVIRYDGVESGELAARLRVPSCLVLSSVSSTLDVVHELASAGAPRGAIVLAEEQVAGRGRMGRRWYSPPQQGIWLGYLSRTTPPTQNGLTSLRAGLAAVHALSSLGATVDLKWPNDLLLDGRKVGGVLCEARWRGQEVQWMAIGIGINVHGPLPATLADRAATLDEVVPAASRVAVLEQLVPALQELPTSDDLSDEERGRFAACNWLDGRTLRAPVAGTARGVALDGALLVETPNGTKRVVGGSIVTV